MNPLSLLWERQLGVFHLGLPGCGACGEAIRAILCEYPRAKYRLMECNSPRHADLVVVTGLFSADLAEEALETLSQAPGRALLAAVGDCALERSAFEKTRREGRRISDLVRIDIVVPGCPVDAVSILEEVRRVSR